MHQAGTKEGTVAVERYAAGTGLVVTPRCCEVPTFGVTMHLNRSCCVCIEYVKRTGHDGSACRVVGVGKRQQHFNIRIGLWGLD